MFLSGFSEIKGFFSIDEEPYKEARFISFIPVVSMFSWLLEQSFLEKEYDKKLNESEKTQSLEKENRISKIIVFGGVVQIVAYLAYCIFSGASLFWSRHTGLILCMTAFYVLLHDLTKEMDKEILIRPKRYQEWENFWKTRYVS